MIPLSFHENNKNMRVNSSFYKYTFCLLLFIFGLCSCGYRLTSSVPLVLPEDIHTLCLVKVINPSTETWLGPYLRSALRDEFTRRGQIKWVDRSQAEGLMEIEINTWSSSTKLEDADDQTVKSEVTLVFQGRIFRQKDHSLLWESRTIVEQEPFTGDENGPDSQSAERRVIDLGMERLADQLSQNF